MVKKSYKTGNLIESELNSNLMEIPPFLEDAFRYETSAKVIFEALDDSYQKEYIDFICEAKKAETRKRRVIRVINMLYEGKKGM